MKHSTNALLVLTTCSKDVAKQLAESLVTERLAACVNITAPITSIYRWDNKLQHDDEQLLLVKTTKQAYPTLERRLGELHPYDVPEIIALPVVAGSSRYLDWLSGEVGNCSVD